MSAQCNFSQIKEGDRVWMISNYGRQNIQMVTKVTATQIVIGANDLYRGERRFRRDNGHHIGGSWGSHRIESIATKQDCSTFDAMEEHQRIISEAKKKAEQQRKDKCETLQKLFPESILVAEEQWGDVQTRRDQFEVTLHNLTAHQVEELATLLNKAPLL